MHAILQVSKAVAHWCCLFIALLSSIIKHQTLTWKLIARKHTYACSSVRFKSSGTALELRFCSSYLSSVTKQKKPTRKNNNNKLN